MNLADCGVWKKNNDHKTSNKSVSGSENQAFNKLDNIYIILDGFECDTRNIPHES